MDVAPRIMVKKDQKMTKDELDRYNGMAVDDFTQHFSMIHFVFSFFFMPP